MSEELKVLYLEPFLGGSHQSFVEGWSRHSRHEFTVIGLPAYQWKWRMRHAPVTLSQELNQRVARGERWDVVVCSDMLSLAEFKGFAGQEVYGLPTINYFHENQLTYPRQEGEIAPRDYHFVYTNFLNSIAADQNWFNSQFHLDEFFTSLERYLNRMPGYQHLELLQAARDRSFVQYPGIGLSQSKIDHAKETGPVTIVWPHRWEYDKNPEMFFAVLKEVASQVDFRLVVVGESFQEKPAVFESARVEFESQLVQFGFVEDKSDYQRLLEQSDIAVSTADHEFFGIAMIECAAHGVVPVVPSRLSYPEIFEIESYPEFFYDGSDQGLLGKLLSLSNLFSQDRGALGKLAVQSQQIAARFAWQMRAKQMDDELQLLVDHHSANAAE